MAKAIINSTRKVLESTYGLDAERLYLGCDDGTTYVFQRPTDSPRWQSLARYGRGGERSPQPSRLPASVEAHMDGRTCSGPYGADSDDYWV